MANPFNEQIVRDFLKAMSANGLENAVDKYLSSDATWWALGIGNVSVSTFPEVDKVWKQNFESFSIDLSDLMSDGCKVAAEAKSYAHLTNGGVYSNTYHFLFELRDGKITRVKEYHDTLHASQVLGPLFAATWPSDSALAAASALPK